MLSWKVIGYGAAPSAVAVRSLVGLAPCYIFVGRWAVLAHVANGMGVSKQTHICDTCLHGPNGAKSQRCSVAKVCLVKVVSLGVLHDS